MAPARPLPMAPFLQKLKVIADTMDRDVAEWSSDGTAYVVKDAARFQTALKTHFKGSLSTFVRQLHFYGFHKAEGLTKSGWSFAHKSFRRDRPDLMNEIKRRVPRGEAPSTGTGASAAEVASLRSQVHKLQGVVASLRSQLDSVLHVLDSAGMSSGLVVGSRGHKRKRSVAESDVTEGDSLRGDDFAEVEADAEDDEELLVDYAEDEHERDRPHLDEHELDESAGEVDSASAARSRSSVKADDDDTVMLDRDDLFARPVVAEGIFEPLPVDDMDLLFAENDLLEALGEVTPPSPSKLHQQQRPQKQQVTPTPPQQQQAHPAEEDENETSAEAVVASETKLDPASVQKVLLFIKKAIKTDSKGATQGHYPEILSAIVNFAPIRLKAGVASDATFPYPVIPAQAVGAAS
jgi:hypothetical protein